MCATMCDAMYDACQHAQGESVVATVKKARMCQCADDAVVEVNGQKACTLVHAVHAVRAVRAWHACSTCIRCVPVVHACCAGCACLPCVCAVRVCRLCVLAVHAYGRCVCVRCRASLPQVLVFVRTRAPPCMHADLRLAEARSSASGYVQAMLKLKTSCQATHP